MNTKQVLSLLLITALATNVCAMEDENKQPGLPEDVRAALAARFKKQRKAEEGEAAQKTENPTTSSTPAGIATPTHVMEEVPMVEAPVAEEPANVSRPESPSKGKEEADAIAPIDQVKQRNADLAKLQQLFARFNALHVRKQQEGILAREFADFLTTKNSERAINAEVEQCLAHLEFINDNYNNDADFGPIADALTARVAVFNLQLQLIENPMNQNAWEDLDETLDQYVIANLETSPQFAQEYQAERDAYAQAREMIAQGHEPSGQKPIEDFTTIDQVRNDALIAQESAKGHMNPHARNQADLDAMFAQAFGEIDNVNANAPEDDAAIAADMAAQLVERQDRLDQMNRDAAEARRLSDEFNREQRRNPVHGPRGNQNNRQPDRAPTPPQPEIPARPQVTTAQAESKFDIKALWSNQSPLMQAAIGAIGASILGVLAYKFYEWMTQKPKVSAKKKSKRMPARRVGLHRNVFARRR